MCWCCLLGEQVDPHQGVVLPGARSSACAALNASGDSPGATPVSTGQANRSQKGCPDPQPGLQDEAAALPASTAISAASGRDLHPLPGSQVSICFLDAVVSHQEFPITFPGLFTVSALEA